MKFIVTDCQDLFEILNDCINDSDCLDFFVLTHISHFLTYFLIFFFILEKKYFFETLIHVTFTSL